MHIDFLIEGKPVQFFRDSFSGTVELRTDETVVELQNVWSPSTHFSLSLTKSWKCVVYGQEVMIEKTRPLLLAAFRPHTYKVFVQGELLTQMTGK